MKNNPKPVNYIYTKSEHYKMFYEKNKTNRLSKTVKLLPETDKMNLFKKTSEFKFCEEIFNNPIETDYNISKIRENFIRIDFMTKSKSYYRLDIHVINEINGIVNHISFTKYDTKYDIIPDNIKDFDEYEESYNRPTERYEMIELMNRIHFILNDMVVKSHISNKFCIGGTEIESKNKIYEYSLKIIVGDGGFEKLKTDIYPRSGWGLYFSI